MTERLRSATLPGNMMLTYSVFETSDDDQAAKKSVAEKSPVEEAVEKRTQAEERLYDQQQLGDHKFYSFTR